MEYGETGRVYAGTVEIREEKPLRELAIIEGWKSAAAKTAPAPQS